LKKRGGYKQAIPTAFWALPWAWPSNRVNQICLLMPESGRRVFSRMFVKKLRLDPARHVDWALGGSVQQLPAAAVNSTFGRVNAAFRAQCKDAPRLRGNAAFKVFKA
jgi:hypothetical protein